MNRCVALVFFALAGCDCRGPRIVTTFDAGCSLEVCDGTDNDCDGRVDEAQPALSCGTGACARTVSSCGDGQALTCTPAAPASEICNGLDDDCDGQADEDLADLTCGVGACATRAPACAAGTPSLCTPLPTAGETCDGIDNDCNGSVDEALGETSCGVGACARSVPACDGGACLPGAPEAERCDGQDNDCDGLIDDGVCLPPTVTCPLSVTTTVGSEVTLGAQANATDSPLVSTRWTVTRRPAASQAQLTSPDSPNTTFEPDSAGLFTFSFCATDSAARSACCMTSVTTQSCSSPPAPPASTACGTSWDGRPVVEFSPVPTGLRYELSLAGQPMLLASATAGHTHLRPTSRIAPGGPMPGVVTLLHLRACRDDDATCCSSPTSVSIDVVEPCTSPIAPTTTNVLLSEYVSNGEGQCPSSDCVTQDTCQAGESVEITNLSNCPVALDGFHFAYRNNNASTASLRWMNFGPGDVIPPRGVYVAIRNRQYAPTCSASLGVERSGLFGLEISSLAMQGSNLCSGWFNNSGGGLSELRLAPGTIAPGSSPTFTPGAAITRVAPYLSTGGNSCASIGFDAVDSCGTVVGGTAPVTQLSPNQLGRLWHPCDVLVGAVPGCVRD